MGSGDNIGRAGSKLRRERSDRDDIGLSKCGTAYMAECLQAASLYVAFRRAGGLPQRASIRRQAEHCHRTATVSATDIWIFGHGRKGIQIPAAGSKVLSAVSDNSVYLSL